jgi:tRNA A37 N6-isopentenylltransferase MiaA
METFSDPLPFPQPAWLAAHSEPNIDAMLELLSDETRRLYRQYLAEEVRAMRPAGMLPAWRAFDRANLEMLRRNKERRAR